MSQTEKIKKRVYEKPIVKSDLIYETMALACVQCLNRDTGTEYGFGDGNCNLGTSTY
jgi:hypothetical protein